MTNNPLTRTCYRVVNLVHEKPTSKKILETTKYLDRWNPSVTDQEVTRKISNNSTSKTTPKSLSETDKKISLSSEVVKPEVISEKETIALSTADKITHVISSALSRPKKHQFPIGDLKYLFLLMEDVAIDDLLNEIAMNTKCGQSTCAGPLIRNLCGFAASSATGKIIDCNGSIMMFFTLLNKIGSKWEFLNFYFSDKTKEEELRKAGKFGQALVSYMHLNQYLSGFESSEEIILSLLQNVPLYEFLNDNDTKNKIFRLI